MAPVREPSPVCKKSAPCTLLSRSGSKRPSKPTSKDLPALEVRRKKLSHQLRCCNDIVKELLSKRHSAYAWPFYAPVDAVALGLHDYHEIIRQPMDLSTIKVKGRGTRVFAGATMFPLTPLLVLRKGWTSESMQTPNSSLLTSDSCSPTATNTIHLRMKSSTWRGNCR